MESPVQDNIYGIDTEPPPKPLPVWLCGVLAGIILVGLAMRIVLPGAMVFCEDQVRACALADDTAGGERPSGGTTNSGGFRNLPGFVYLLAGVWSVWGHPLALHVFITSVNIAAVLGSAWLVRRWVGSAAAWWSTAFLAAGPWAIHYSRWIWAQDLMFPVAVLVYVFLWQWLHRGRRWAAFGVIASLTLLMQIHLVGIVLALAIGLLVLWIRPRLPVWPVVAGIALAAASVAPYLLAGYLSAPGGNRLGYRHIWRIAPAAGMSLTGVGWSLEFKAGYPAFVQYLGWRRWAYDGWMVVPVVLFAVAIVWGGARLWRDRGKGRASRRAPLAMTTALVLLIPVSFVLLGIRTSPTYLPIWYPLPFVLMGWAAVRLTRGGSGRLRPVVVACLLLALIAQLLFFADQWTYAQRRGGVPGSILGRSYGGCLRDVREAASEVQTAEVWLLYEGPSPIQRETAAYLFRRADWPDPSPGRALIRFRWWTRPGESPVLIEPIPPGARPPDEAFLVRPWTEAQQHDSKIPRRPREHLTD